MKHWLYKNIRYALLATGIIIVTIAPLYAKIAAYMPYYALYKESSPDGTYTRYIILREFKLNAKHTFLYVNPTTLHTGILKNPQGTIIKDSLQNIIGQCADTQYAKLYQKALQKSKRMFNAGLTHFDIHGTIISFDLCPSKRAIDSEFIEQFIASQNNNLPVPVVVCISGKWMMTHPEDLQWLKGLAYSRKLDITWVNHSYTHFYSRKLPVKKNFMLKEDTCVSREVLQNEIMMLEHNIIPSIFFRFPGLISNQKIYEKVIGYGLIPLGADAWLAKGKKPVDGSIVLVHPNGNEKKGTKLLLSYQQSGVLKNPVSLSIIVNSKQFSSNTTQGKQSSL